MPDFRCPGQDMRYWKPEDICLVGCPYCHGEIEFWKDEPMRICNSCGHEVRHPKKELGCAQWCKHAIECIGFMSEGESQQNGKSSENTKEKPGNTRDSI